MPRDPTAVELAGRVLCGFASARRDATAPAVLHPANLMFRGIPVPAGTHSIELHYVPLGFTLGLGLFLLAAVTCVYLWLAARVPNVGR
jgi:uncharacterized membrane protein YfhO